MAFVGFHFIGPPIGERGGADAGGGDFIGNFVAFENVLQRAHLEAKFFRDAKQHQDFVFAVAMRVNVALAFQNFDQRIEPQIAARRNQIFLAGGDCACCSRPMSLCSRALPRKRRGWFLPRPCAWRDSELRGRGC